MWARATLPDSTEPIIESSEVNRGTHLSPSLWRHPSEPGISKQSEKLELVLEQRYARHFSDVRNSYATQFHWKKKQEDFHSVLLLNPLNEDLANHSQCMGNLLCYSF